MGGGRSCRLRGQTAPRTAERQRLPFWLLRRAWSKAWLNLHFRCRTGRPGNCAFGAILISGFCGPPVGRELALMEALNHAENMIEAESLRRGYSFTRFLISTLRRLIFWFRVESGIRNCSAASV